MKIRTGYVSNSSSSSYTCQVCGRTESGYDLTLDDAQMVMCSCGREYCIDHAVNSTKVSEALKFLEDYKDDGEISGLYEKLKAMNPDDIFSENTSPEDWKTFFGFFRDLEYGDNMPDCFCPICNMVYIPDDDMLKYVLHECNLEKDRVENEMKFRFQKRSELMDFLKGDKK